MIVDKIQNLETYKNLSPDIYAGLKFLQGVTPDIELGTYVINDHVKAIVSEYPTVECFERGYEAHKHNLDIQFPVVGMERIKYSPIEGMDVNIPYEEHKDRTFYKNPDKYGFDVIIGNGTFAIMFPQDGHGPQHLVEKSEVIKKVTVKVSI